MLKRKQDRVRPEDDFNLGSLCNFLAARGVFEGSLIEITKESGLAKNSRPGTGKYIFSRGLKHLGAVVGLGIGGTLFAFLPDLFDGSVDFPAQVYGLSSFFGIVGGYCDWYRPSENKGIHEVGSPKEMKRQFYVIANNRYSEEVSDFFFYKKLFQKK